MLFVQIYTNISMGFTITKFHHPNIFLSKHRNIV